MLCAAGFVDDVTLTHKRTDKGDANSMYAQSDSSRAAPGTTSDIHDWRDVLVPIIVQEAVKSVPISHLRENKKEGAAGAQQNIRLTTYFPGQPG